MKVAIKSVKGTYHEIAAKQYFQNEQRIDIIEKKDLESLLDCVTSGEADYGLIEIENTITGTVYQYLNLIKEKNVSIIGEIYQKGEKNLAALPGSSMEKIKFICGEHTAIEQTRKFFEKYPDITLIECGDLSIAGREIKEKNLLNVGIVGGKLAAKVYGFNILLDKIDSDKKNYTRFFIIQGKTKVEKKDFNKATLHILLPNQVGSLTQILGIIVAYGMNLTKIESVPIIGEAFHYSFYVDINFTDSQRYHDMITAIRPLLKQLDILGEYTAFDKILTEE